VEIPLWFGPADRSLFAMATVPADGCVSGAVVLCQPLGVEADCSRRTFATLSSALADAGLLAIRFDYDGTGDSVGSDEDGGRVQGWVGAVRQAIGLARQSGASRVAVVGMRLGATLATSAADSAGAGMGEDLLDALVLWDPYVSGRAFVRAQRALHLVLFNESTDGDGQREDSRSVGDDSVEAPGMVFGAETVAAMRSLDIGSVEGPLAKQILVLARDVQPQGAKAIERFIAERSAERWATHGQELLVDVRPDFAQVPIFDVDAVTAWLADVLGGERTQVSLPRRDEAVVGGGESGQIVERIVSLGPGLFGIMTETPEAGSSGRAAGPTMVFLNTGIADHTGPVRLWVTLSRRWAQQGLRSVRVDLSGLGFSPARPGRPVDVATPPEALDDLVDMAEAVSPDDPGNVVFVGLCSGGYHAIEGALALGARGVCAINPVLNWKPAEVDAEQATDERRQAAPVRKRWVRALPAHDKLGPLVERMPHPVWWVLNRVAVEQSPARAMRQLVDRGVRTFIVSGEIEWRVMWRGERRAYREIERRNGFRQVVVPAIDHALLQRDARELVSRIVTEDTLAAYATDHAPAGTEERERL
jgi:pimeloyl-ACP methyl ester carboxylesterase